MSRTSFRRSTLDKGSSTTNLGHAVINPRIRDRSTVVAQPRLLPWAAASGTSNIGKPGEHAVTPAMLENGHESVNPGAFYGVTPVGGTAAVAHKFLVRSGEGVMARQAVRIAGHAEQEPPLLVCQQLSAPQGGS